MASELICKVIKYFDDRAIAVCLTSQTQPTANWRACADLQKAREAKQKVRGDKQRTKEEQKLGTNAFLFACVIVVCLMSQTRPDSPYADAASAP